MNTAKLMSAETFARQFAAATKRISEPGEFAELRAAAGMESVWQAGLKAVARFYGLKKKFNGGFKLDTVAAAALVDDIKP